MKTTRKLLSLVLAAALVFALAIPALATDYTVTYSAGTGTGTSSNIIATDGEIASLPSPSDVGFVAPTGMVFDYWQVGADTTEYPVGEAVTGLTADTTITANWRKPILTIGNTVAGYEYHAFQVFKGTNLNNASLTNISWGDGVNVDALKTALAGATFSVTPNPFAALAATATAADYADVMADITSNTSDAEVLAEVIGKNLSSTSTTLTLVTGEGYQATVDTGYYFVKDMADHSSDGAAFTKYILEVVQDVTANPKSVDVPSVEKKVDGQDGTADYKVGDSIPYSLTATLPAADSYGKYETYYLKFTDTLDAGLTPPVGSSITVKLNGSTDITDKVDITVTGQVITVTIADTKATGIEAAAGDTIVVSYNAVLNTNAVITENGTDNKVYLTFSNDPNYEPTPGEVPPTSDTPEEIVPVGLVKLTINKTDGTDPLAGAKFRLSRKVSGSYVAVGEDQGDGVSDTEFVWDKLPDGDYKLEETKTPDGFNTIEPILFTITSTFDATTGNRTDIDVSSALGATVVNADGTIEATIVNNSGSELPQTGGIGTTLFITFGMIAVLAAGVFLVTNKRISKEEI